MKKALLVGLTKYPNCELNWCDNDAIAMKELLEAMEMDRLILRLCLKPILVLMILY